MDKNMILKLILLGIVMVAVYKFVGGTTALSSSEKEQSENDADALEECHTCGTYVTRRESIIVKGKYYCSKECLPG